MIFLGDRISITQLLCAIAKRDLVIALLLLDAATTIAFPSLLRLILSCCT